MPSKTYTKTKTPKTPKTTAAGTPTVEHDLDTMFGTGGPLGAAVLSAANVDIDGDEAEDKYPFSLNADTVKDIPRSRQDFLLQDPATLRKTQLKELVDAHHYVGCRNGASTETARNNINQMMWGAALPARADFLRAIKAQHKTFPETAMYHNQAVGPKRKQAQTALWNKVQAALVHVDPMSDEAFATLTATRHEKYAAAKKAYEEKRRSKKTSEPELTTTKPDLCDYYLASAVGNFVPPAGEAEQVEQVGPYIMVFVDPCGYFADFRQDIDPKAVKLIDTIRMGASRAHLACLDRDGQIEFVRAMQAAMCVHLSMLMDLYGPAPEGSASAEAALGAAGEPPAAPADTPVDDGTPGEATDGEPPNKKSRVDEAALGAAGESSAAPDDDDAGMEDAWEDHDDDDDDVVDAEGTIYDPKTGLRVNWVPSKDILVANESDEELSSAVSYHYVSPPPDAAPKPGQQPVMRPLPPAARPWPQEVMPPGVQADGTPVGGDAPGKRVIDWGAHTLTNLRDCVFQSDRCGTANYTRTAAYDVVDDDGEWIATLVVCPKAPLNVWTGDARQKIDIDSDENREHRDGRMQSVTYQRGWPLTEEQSASVTPVRGLPVVVPHWLALLQKSDQPDDDDVPAMKGPDHTSLAVAVLLAEIEQLNATCNSATATKPEKDADLETLKAKKREMIGVIEQDRLWNAAAALHTDNGTRVPCSGPSTARVPHPGVRDAETNGCLVAAQYCVMVNDQDQTLVQNAETGDWCAYHAVALGGRLTTVGAGYTVGNREKKLETASSAAMQATDFGDAKPCVCTAFCPVPSRVTGEPGRVQAGYGMAVGLCHLDTPFTTMYCEHVRPRVLAAKFPLTQGGKHPDCALASNGTHCGTRNGKPDKAYNAGKAEGPPPPAGKGTKRPQHLATHNQWPLEVNPTLPDLLTKGANGTDNAIHSCRKYNQDAGTLEGIPREIPVRGWVPNDPDDPDGPGHFVTRRQKVSSVADIIQSGCWEAKHTAKTEAALRDLLDSHFDVTHMMFGAEPITDDNRVERAHRREAFIQAIAGHHPTASQFQSRYTVGLRAYEVANPPGEEEEEAANPPDEEEAPARPTRATHGVPMTKESRVLDCLNAICVAAWEKHDPKDANGVMSIEELVGLIQREDKEWRKREAMEATEATGAPGPATIVVNWARTYGLTAGGVTRSDPVVADPTRRWSAHSNTTPGGVTTPTGGSMDEEAPQAEDTPDRTEELAAILQFLVAWNLVDPLLTPAAMNELRFEGPKDWPEMLRALNRTVHLTINTIVAVNSPPTKEREEARLSTQKRDEPENQKPVNNFGATVYDVANAASPANYKYTTQGMSVAIYRHGRRCTDHDDPMSTTAEAACMTLVEDLRREFSGLLSNGEPDDDHRETMPYGRMTFVQFLRDTELFDEAELKGLDTDAEWGALCAQIIPTLRSMAKTSDTTKWEDEPLAYKIVSLLAVFEYMVAQPLVEASEATLGDRKGQHRIQNAVAWGDDKVRRAVHPSAVVWKAWSQTVEDVRVETLQGLYLHCLAHKPRLDQAFSDEYLAFMRRLPRTAVVPPSANTVVRYGQYGPGNPTWPTPHHAVIHGVHGEQTTFSHRPRHTQRHVTYQLGVSASTEPKNLDWLDRAMRAAQEPVFSGQLLDEPVVTVHPTAAPKVQEKTRAKKRTGTAKTRTDKVKKAKTAKTATTATGQTRNADDAPVADRHGGMSYTDHVKVHMEAHPGAKQTDTMPPPTQSRVREWVDVFAHAVPTLVPAALIGHPLTFEDGDDTYAALVDNPSSPSRIPGFEELGRVLFGEQLPKDLDGKTLAMNQDCSVWTMSLRSVLQTDDRLVKLCRLGGVDAPLTADVRTHVLKQQAESYGTGPGISTQGLLIDLLTYGAGALPQSQALEDRDGNGCGPLLVILFMTTIVGLIGGLRRCDTKGRKPLLMHLTAHEARFETLRTELVDGDNLLENLGYADSGTGNPAMARTHWCAHQCALLALVLSALHLIEIARDVCTKEADREATQSAKDKAVALFLQKKRKRESPPAVEEVEEVPQVPQLTATSVEFVKVVFESDADGESMKVDSHQSE